MKNPGRDLPVHAFESAGSLRQWLMKNHARSDGIRVRISRKNSRVSSVTFEEVLDEGLCLGWMKA